MSCVYFFQESPRPEHDRIRYRCRRRTAVITAAFGGPYGDGLIKIGYTSKRPAFRASEVASQAQRSIAVLGTIPGPFANEARVHRMFEHLRTPGPSGAREWFRPEWELLTFISSLPVYLQPAEVEFTGIRGSRLGVFRAQREAHLARSSRPNTA